MGAEIRTKTDAGKKPAYLGVYNRVTKRVLDLLLALFFLVFAIPLYLLIGAAILLEDGRPIFYRPHQIGGGTTALNDPRITKVGQLLRKTKLDETANLLNILRGTMSFIGPRPELLRYTEKYTPAEQAILMVRPGVTDYSSIEFINLDEIVGTENADEMYEKYVLKRKNELRLKYAETVSFRTDAKIFITTVARVIRKALRFIGKGK